MTGKQHPRTSSIVSSFQKFKRTPSSADEEKHKQNLIEQNSSMQQDKKSSTGAQLSPHVNKSSQNNKPWRHVSLPLPTQLSQSNKAKNKGKEKEGERSKSQARLWNFHAPRLSIPLKRSQTTTISRPYSRIPTPTKPPQGDAYSHTVYQNEGRRSVLSSLGRRYTSLQMRRTPGKEQQNSNMKGKNVSSDRNTQAQSAQNNGGKHEPCSYSGPGAAAASSSVPRQARRESMPNTRITHSAVQNTISRSHTMLPVRDKTATSSIPGLNMSEQPRYQRRRSLPPYSSYSEQRPTQIQGGSGALASSRVAPGIPRSRAEDGSQVRSQIEEYEKSEMTRKARVRASIGASSSAQRPGTNRLSGTFASRPAAVDANRDQGDSLSRSRVSGPKSPENPNTATRERSRKLERAERMAQRATINNIKAYSSSPSRILDENEPPGHNTDTQQRLSRSPTRFLHQVSHPQPRQYWLGRFVTLVNAFHYEDSFNQPDAATGFGMISSYSRPLGSAERLLPDYRTKRAFMVLENACVTDEANKSLREFQDEYIAIYGDRWMG